MKHLVTSGQEELEVDVNQKEVVFTSHGPGDTTVVVVLSHAEALHLVNHLKYNIETAIIKG